MKKFLSGVATGILIGTIPTVFALSKIFSDVPSNEWYAGSVLSLSEKGIIKGYPDGTFKPEKNVSRAEMAVMLDRLLNYIKIPSMQIAESIGQEYDDGEIFKCEEYYKVLPPTDLDDAPDVMFDSTGQLTAYCGGMPFESAPEPAQQCSITCNTTGTFLNINN